MKKIMMVDDEEDQTFGIKIALEDSYGDKYETTKRVAKKIIRTALILKYHFNLI